MRRASRAKRPHTKEPCVRGETLLTALLAKGFAPMVVEIKGRMKPVIKSGYRGFEREVGTMSNGRLGPVRDKETVWLRLADGSMALGQCFLISQATKLDRACRYVRDLLRLGATLETGQMQSKRDTRAYGSVRAVSIETPAVPRAKPKKEPEPAVMPKVFGKLPVTRRSRMV